MLFVISFATERGCSQEPDRRRPFEWLIPGTVHDENGAPVPGAIVESFGSRYEVAGSTVANKDGKFVLQFRASSQNSRGLMIRSPDDSLASFVPDVGSESRKLLRVVLQPWRRVTVHVLNKDGQPVPEALVETIASRHFIPLREEIASCQTDGNGQATLQLPADAIVEWITARHDGLGFDYYENYNSFPTSERLKLPQELTLTLNGASNVNVKVVDSKDRPIAGVGLIPWTIQKKGKLSRINLSSMPRGVISDEHGVSRFPWMPADLNGRVSFLITDPNLHCPQPAVFPNNGPLIAKVFRTAILRGTITYADGSPAKGIHLQGEGRGDTNHYFRGHTMTVEDGTYEIHIYPDQSTILAVTENAWAAKSQTGIKLREGEVKENVDFVVDDGTLLKGRITLGPDADPYVGENVTLLQKAHGTDLVRWSKTDKNGNYRFRIGPGDYSLHLPNEPWQDAVNLVVEDQKEIVRDGHSARKERVNLTGLIVDSDGEPIGDCLVYGESIDVRGHAGFHSKVDPKGQFSTERWSDRMLLYGVSNELGLAGFAEIEEDDVEVHVKLAPAAMVKGRVLDSTGKPQTNATVVLSLGRPANRSVRLRTQTDEFGQYQFPAIAPGIHCDINVYVGSESASGEGFDVKDLTEITVKDIITAAADVP